MEAAPISIQIAKEEIVRINNELGKPHLLIGGLAVQRYIVTRDSKDIDLVCDYETARSLVSKLYPTDQWDVVDLNDDSYRPNYLITHQYMEYGEISIGPKIIERSPYNYINWDHLLASGSPYQFKGSRLERIIIPSCTELAFTKLTSVR